MIDLIKDHVPAAAFVLFIALLTFEGIVSRVCDVFEKRNAMKPIAESKDAP